MGIIREYEVLLEKLDRQIDEKIKRVIRIKHEVNTLVAEQEQLDREMADLEKMVQRIRKDQYKEEDKVINKIRLQGVVSEERQTKNRKRTCR